MLKLVCWINIHIFKTRQQSGGRTYSIPTRSFFIQARPPLTIKQPPTREENPSVDWEKEISNTENIQSQSRWTRPWLLLRKELFSVKEFGFELVGQRNPEGRIANRCPTVILGTTLLKRAFGRAHKKITSWRIPLQRSGATRVHQHHYRAAGGRKPRKG